MGTLVCIYTHWIYFVVFTVHTMVFSRKLNLLLSFSLDLVYCGSVHENAQHNYKHLRDPQSEYTFVGFKLPFKLSFNVSAEALFNLTGGSLGL